LGNVISPTVHCNKHNYDDRIICQGATTFYQVPDVRCSNCSAVAPEVASSTLGVSKGGFPYSLRSGVTSARHESQIIPYVQTVDYYDQLSPLDDTTSCSLRRMNDGNFTGSRILPNGAITKSNLVVVDGTSTSYHGKVYFNELVMKGDIGVVYFVEASCQGHPGITVNGNITIGPCAPGEALDATRSCKECPENTYSPRGEACMNCPPGKYSVKRRRSNVAVIIVKVVFIGAFLFYCLLSNHSFQTNPNKITNCFKLFSLCYKLTTTFAPASLF
jgi:hypothetical protein